MNKAVPSSPAKVITWLHLSDAHLCAKKTGWDAKRVIEKLQHDIGQMKAQFDLQPDLIFFTGDLAFGELDDAPIKPQFAEGMIFFEQLRNIFTPPIPKKNLFVVPGNHDVNRSMVTDSDTLWQDALREKDAEEATSSLNMNMRDATLLWRRLMDRLVDYKSFLDSASFSHLLENPMHLNFRQVRRIRGYTISITGLNSAWSSCRRDEKGKLWLGEWQLGTLPSELPNVAINIVLSHHPTSWLADAEEAAIKQKLENDFCFHLHGHEHDAWVSDLGHHVRIASGACYAPARKEKETGYHFVRLFPEEARGEVFLRRYEERAGGGWVPCVVPKRTDANGRWPLDRLARLQKRRLEATGTRSRSTISSIPPTLSGRISDYFYYGEKDQDHKYTELLPGAPNS